MPSERVPDDWHGDTILKTYRHSQVYKYISKQHREDSDYYAHFQALRKRLQDASIRSATPSFKRAREDANWVTLPSSRSPAHAGRTPQGGMLRVES